LETLIAAVTKGRRINLDLEDMTLTVKRKERISMSENNGRVKRSEKGPLTPDNCAVAFIDSQPQMLFGVSNFDRHSIINNVVALAKATRIFDVRIILSTVETKAFSGLMWLQLKAVFPGWEPIERLPPDAWDDPQLLGRSRENRPKEACVVRAVDPRQRDADVSAGGCQDCDSPLYDPRMAAGLGSTRHLRRRDGSSGEEPFSRRTAQVWNTPTRWYRDGPCLDPKRPGSHDQTLVCSHRSPEGYRSVAQRHRKHDKSAGITGGLTAGMSKYGHPAPIKKLNTRPIALVNCDSYVRDWMTRQQSGN
jgi:hypothetical protein